MSIPPSSKKKYETLLEQTHDACLDWVSKVPFDIASNQSVMTFGMYISILEYSKTIHSLSITDSRTGFSSVFRSLMEAFVDFKNISTNEQYYLQKEAKHHLEWKKFLNSATSDNPFLKSIANSPDKSTRIAEHEKAIVYTTELCVQPYSITEAFRTAGMAHDYNAIYRSESSEVHNEFRGILNRHGLFKENKLEGLKIYIGPDIEYFVLRLHASIDWLLKSTVQLSACTEVAILKEVEDAQEAFSELALEHAERADLPSN